MKISTLKKVLCTLSIGVALLLGMSIPAQAQRRYPPAYGRRNIRPYGQIVSARRHRRNELRRGLRLHQRDERRILSARLRNERGTFGNRREWRNERKQEREALKRHQHEEKRAFKERWKNNRGRL